MKGILSQHIQNQNQTQSQIQNQNQSQIQNQNQSQIQNQIQNLMQNQTQTQSQIQNQNQSQIQNQNQSQIQNQNQSQVQNQIQNQIQSQNLYLILTQKQKQKAGVTASPSDLFLIAPAKEHEKEALEYIQEHLFHGESKLPGTSHLEKKASYGEWLKHIEKTKRPDTVDPLWAPASTFFAVRKPDNKIVGAADIRYYLNSYLRDYGGHIGYGVRPTERQKGYAKQILSLGLGYCKAIGMKNVLLTCFKENISSAKAILACGGIKERETIYFDGRRVSLFWFELGQDTVISNLLISGHT